MAATLAASALLSTSAFAQTFTLISPELGGQLTNKQFFDGSGIYVKREAP
ncbi:hypothetical protein [Hymenobacter crusticola]|nr:hypothetical protein [Hymenobacter crusticola]